MEFIDKDINEQLNRELEHPAYEMANVSKEDTGLPYDLWIDSIGVDRKGKHSSPRLKVQVNGKLIPVLISENPDIPDSLKRKGLKDFPHLSEVKKYIKAYLKVLLMHYNKQLTDRETLTILSTVDQASGPSLGEVLAKKQRKGGK